MARDDVFPFSNYLRWVLESNKTPLGAVFLAFITGSLLLLFQLVSNTAFVATFPVSALCYHISYLVPIFLRCTTARHTLPVGSLNLGRFSIPIAIISCVWFSITIIFMLFPTEYPVTRDNMNYSIVIVSGYGFVAGVYWFVSARHKFIGPNREVIDPTRLPSRFNNSESTTTLTDIHAPNTILTHF